MADKNGNNVKTDPKDYTEKEIMELIRSADDSSKQVAMLVLKNEKPGLGETITLIKELISGEGSKGQKAVDALNALSVMMKNKAIDLKQIQDIAAAANGLLNSPGSNQEDDADNSK